MAMKKIAGLFPAPCTEVPAIILPSFEMGARRETIAARIGAHPIRGKAFREAAFKAFGHALTL